MNESEGYNKQPAKAEFDPKATTLVSEKDAIKFEDFDQTEIRVAEIKAAAGLKALINY